MAKDILLYGGISEYNALYFFSQIKEALKDDPQTDLELRINVEGGSPEYGIEVIRKVQENSDSFFVKVGSACHSMGLFILCYVPKEKIEVLDVTQSCFHRAAYPDWIEGDSSFPGSMMEESLAKTNKDLEKAMRARIDVEALENLPQMKERNLTLKDIFSMEGRQEVLLTGKDLKTIGLAGSLVKITPKKEAEMKSVLAKFKICNSLEDYKKAASIEPEKTESKNKIMTREEIQAQHPALYNEIFNLGIVQGQSAEKERVEACMVYAEIDPIGVKAAIESGKPLSMKQMAEFNLKIATSGSLEALKKAGVEVKTEPTPETVEKERTAKQLKEAAFLKEVASHAGLKGEKKFEVSFVDKVLN